MELNIDSNDPLEYFDDCIFKKQLYVILSNDILKSNL
ncbi:hypothetical protein T03_8008 [Trichinella britovi]|uniref:Uncharacterized protein n=1 Tax=Trichinella britovi TaxID=45882 RepID=A0A0V1ALE7_TRIBR|nr:hypothetical protein T03_8008 [Trichinella britovi]